MKKNNTLFIVFCIFSIAVLGFTYSNHFHNSFHFDDFSTIVSNVYIQDIKNIPLFFKEAQTHTVILQNQKYRPLLSTTFAIDYRLGGGFNMTFYFHLSTFIWYTLQCILMYFLYLKIFNGALQHEWNKYVALFGASWYALHPANAETVNYIYQRGDVLSTFMVIAGFVIFMYFPKSRNRFIYLIPVTIGMFIKEPTAMFAPLLFVYIMLFEKQFSLRDSLMPNNFINIFKSSLPAFIVCIALSVFVFSMRSSTDSPGGTFLPYLITQPFVILHYFITFLFPLELSADSDWKAFQSIFDIRVIIGVVFIGIMVFFSYVTSKKREIRPVAFGILWFFLALIPTSSIIPLGEVLNDHRMFFPFVGLALSISWTAGLVLIKNREKIHRNSLKIFIIFIAFGILCGYAYGTHQRNKVWHTEESLWYDVTVKSPKNGRGLMNYGLSQMEKGKFEKAEEYFKRALEFTPYYSFLHINMGVLKGAMNQPEEAEQYFHNAIKYNPQNPQAYFHYAKWLAERNQIHKAIPLLRKAVDLSPAYSNARVLLDRILAFTKSSLSSIQRSEELVSSQPTPDAYLNLSLQYHNAGRFEDSIKACKKALKIDPDYYLAYNNICSAYNELKMWDKAIEACKKGLGIKPDYQLMQNNLAFAQRQKSQQ